MRLPLLQRLIDEAPDEKSEREPEEHEAISLLHKAVRDDLENLLNTRFRVVAWPQEMTHLQDTLVNYGIPDFTAASLNAAQDPDILIGAIRKAIAMFEPRLTNVRVEQMGQFHIDRTFRFRIVGTIVVDNRGHRVQFDTALQSATGQFDVS